MNYETVIGLEIHCQLGTKTKLFCGCDNSFTLDANTKTCPGCLAMPGVLPALNEQALEYALTAALALNCEINDYCYFERKYYFYPDLSSGFQTSQLQHAVGHKGYLEFKNNEKIEKVRINRIQLEEDAGKLIHNTRGESLIDLNRAGSPLIEIVSEPDLRSAASTKTFLELLRLTLIYCGVSKCNMEEGALRCDANVSIRPVGSKEYGVRNEIKNLNTFRGVENAINLLVEELKRCMEEKEEIKQLTWGYSLEKNRLYKMRSKEELTDYRYSPAPDLPIIDIDRGMVQKLTASLPELPLAKAERFNKEYALTDYEANIIVQDYELANYFENIVAVAKLPKEAANWLINDIMRELNERKLELSNFPVKPEAVAELITLVDTKKVNLVTAKKIFNKILDGEELSPTEIVAKEGLEQVSDTTEINKVLENIIQDNPKQYEEVVQGKNATLMWFMGRVMRAMAGKAEPGVVTEVLAKRFGVDVSVFQKKKK